MHAKEKWFECIVVRIVQCISHQLLPFLMVAPFFLCRAVLEYLPPKIGVQKML